MREQELQMKKQVMPSSRSLSPVCVCLVFNQLLTQAAEWKLQAKELKEQHTVMQAQVNIYRCGITHNPTLSPL